MYIDVSIYIYIYIRIYIDIVTRIISKENFLHLSNVKNVDTKVKEKKGVNKK